MSLDETDLGHLRRCVELAQEALEAGDQPFASLLVDGSGVAVSIAVGTGPAVAARAKDGREECSGFFVFDHLGGSGLGSLRTSHSPAGTRDGGEVELDADVVAEDEAPGGHPQGVRQPVPAVEPQPGDAVADQQRRGGDE